MGFESTWALVLPLGFGLRGLGPLGSLGGWMCMNGLLINMGFDPSFGLWPSSFSVLVLDHGPHHFMLQNRPKTYKK